MALIGESKKKVIRCKLKTYFIETLFQESEHPVH